MSTVYRLHLADVVYPEWHPNTGTGPVYAFAVDTSAGLFLVDTGLGPPHDRIDALYRPARFPIDEALAHAGFRPEDVRGIVISHLHFDHVGNAQLFPGVPVYVQAAEREAAKEPGYTIAEFVDAPGIEYRLLEGYAEPAPGLEVIPTPGHTPGHQSVLVDATEFIAAQAAESIDDLTPELLERWLGRRAADLSQVHVSHDHRIWRTADARG